MNKLIIVALLSASFTTVATENNLANVLNGNGSVGNVTINQSSSITNEQVESQEKIDNALLQAYKQIENGNQNANILSVVADMANNINKEYGTSKQKNGLCKSRAKLGAEVFGYKLDFAFGKCDEFFIIQ